jgi:hypothetical protein
MLYDDDTRGLVYEWRTVWLLRYNDDDRPSCFDGASIIAPLEAAVLVRSPLIRVSSKYAMSARAPPRLG